MKIFLILVLLFAVSCEDKNIPRKCLVVISDANPVKFWINGQETFNLKEVPGVFSRCFCLPFECDDEITIQFDAEESVGAFKLYVWDTDGQLIHDFDFTNVTGTVWRLSFIPSNFSPDLCDQDVIFHIVKGPMTYEYNFTSNLDGWVEESVGATWAWSSGHGGSALATLNSGNGSRRLYKDSLSFSDKNYKAVMSFTVEGTADNLQILFEATNASGSVTYASYGGGGSVVVSPVPPGSYTVVMDMRGSSNITRLQVRFTDPAGGLAPAVYITKVVVYEADWYSFGPELLTNHNFTSNLNGWVNEDTGTSWVWDAGVAPDYVGVAGMNIPIAAAIRNSKLLTQYVNLNKAETYRIFIDYQFSNADLDAQLLIILSDGVTSKEIVVKTISAADGPGQYLTSFFITADREFDRIQLKVQANEGDSADTVFLVDELSVKKVTSDFYLSDCISIKESHDETVLITYSNHRDFADLDSLNVSPDTEFNLRVPGVFFKERFPQESEVIELSNSTSVQLNAQVKAQKLLSIGPVPFYMHRKINLVLAHQFLSIDDEDWVKQESYELSESKRTHPLSQAKVWLTEKGFIKRNVL